MKRTLTAKQAGAIVNRSADAISKWATTGGLECDKTSAGRLYNRDEVIAYAKKLRAEKNGRFSAGAFGDLPPSIQKNILETVQEIAKNRDDNGGRFYPSAGGSFINHLAGVDTKLHGVKK